MSIKSDQENILIKNKPIILKNVLDSYNFSQKEIDDINKNFNQQGKYTDIIEYLRREDSSGRECLLSDIYEATKIENLIKIDNFFALRIKEPDEELLRILETLRLFER